MKCKHPKAVNIILWFVVFSSVVTSCSMNSVRIRRAEILYNEGQSLIANGKSEDALEKFEKSLLLARESGFKAGVAHNLNEMAIIHTTKGEYDKAREKLNEAMDTYRELNMPTEVSKALNNIALTFVRQGNFIEAINRYNELLKWDDETGNQLGMGITLNNMGLIYEHNLRSTGEAQKKYLEALIIFEKIGNEKYIKLIKKNIEN